MIHKFDDIPVNINTRSSIVVLVDEAHRTTGGDLGNYLMGALPSATYIGFTGTPVDRLSKGQGTFKVFGPDDLQGYLDKYSIAESIADGTTVKLNYALAPSDLRVDRETLEREFLNLAQAEGVADVEELNAILDQAVALKELMKAPDRVARIARYVAADFQERILPMGFKAFLVAVDREACALYKQELDRLLPPEWSAVVISAAHNDPELLRQYALTPDQEKEARNAFRKKDMDPRILIVTEKLLTGFDAPILYCMYLDKPMRDHVLLQAIARVNRPYEDEDGLLFDPVEQRIAGLMPDPNTHLAIKTMLEPRGWTEEDGVLWNRDSARVLTPQRPNRYFQIMQMLKRGPATSADVQRFLGMKRQNVAEVVARMIEQRMVSRRSIPKRNQYEYTWIGGDTVPQDALRLWEDRKGRYTSSSTPSVLSRRKLLPVR